jgi:hypothetical protein
MRWRQVYEAQLETKLEADRMAAMLEQAMPCDSTNQ